LNEFSVRVPYAVGIISGLIFSTLNSNYFLESESRRINFPNIPAAILSEIVKYLYYHNEYINIEENSVDKRIIQSIPLSDVNISKAAMIDLIHRFNYVIDNSVQGVESLLILFEAAHYLQLNFFHHIIAYRLAQDFPRLIPYFNQLFDENLSCLLLYLSNPCLFLSEFLLKFTNRQKLFNKSLWQKQLECNHRVVSKDIRLARNVSLQSSAHAMLASTMRDAELTADLTIQSSCIAQKRQILQ
jgi:hypothetical protein